MNLGEIVARTMRNINFVYNDRDHIKNLINEAQMLLASDAKLQASQIITLVPGQTNYTLPAGYREPINLVDGELCNYTLTYIGSYESGYYIYGNELVFRPAPQEGKGVTFYYYQYPNELYNEEDVPVIDERYHDVLATYAAAMVLSLPGIPNVSNTLIERYFSVWEQRKMQFKTGMQRKSKQTSVNKVTNYD